MELWSLALQLGCCTHSLCCTQCSQYVLGATWSELIWLKTGYCDGGDHVLSTSEECGLKSSALSLTLACWTSPSLNMGTFFQPLISCLSVHRPFIPSASPGATTLMGLVSVGQDVPKNCNGEILHILGKIWFCEYTQAVA